METKKLVVFGLGARGTIYANFAKTYPEKFELVAIIENNPKRLELAKKEYPGTRLFENCHDFLGEKISVDIVAVADLIPGKAQALCERYGVEGVHYYLSGHEMLEAEDLDAVSVCTYNTQHAPCAIDALEHGCHVLLEKPFTVTLDEAIAVMRAEKKSGKIIF